MKSFKVKAVLVTTILFWASAFVGIRIGLTSYSPGALALLRFLVASLCMGIIYHSQPVKREIPWRVRGQLLLAGVGGIGIYHICLNIGEMSVSAGIASFIIGLMPVMTVVLSLLILRERLALGAWTGIFISLFGLMVLAWGEGSQVDMKEGILFILVSAFMGALLTLIQKQFLKRYNPIAIITWVMWGGTCFLLYFLPDLIQEIQTAEMHATLATIYMGIFPAALCYLAWGYVLKHFSAAKATVALYALPITSTLMGFILLGEKPSPLSLIGGGIALIGAFIANYYQKPQPQITPITLAGKELNAPS